MKMVNHSTHQPAGRAFTLVELQVALVVTGIILAAVVSLGFALNAAEEDTQDMGRQQAVLRYADGRIRRLIQQSNAVMSVSPTGVELWKDENVDGTVDASECFFIEAANESSSIVYRTDTQNTVLIPCCSNVAIKAFSTSSARFVVVQFDLEENGQTNTYQIAASLWCRDEHVGQ